VLLAALDERAQLARGADDAARAAQRLQHRRRGGRDRRDTEPFRRLAQALAEDLHGVVVAIDDRLRQLGDALSEAVAIDSGRVFEDAADTPARFALDDAAPLGVSMRPSAWKSRSG